MDWLRWHHGTVESGRWRAVAKRSGQPVCAVVAVWALLCETASRAHERGVAEGWNDEDAGAALDMAAESVSAIREAMQGRALEGLRLVTWAEEQVKREREDRSVDRVRAFRERKHGVTINRTVSRRVTPRNAMKRPEERRVDKKRELPPPEGSGEPLADAGSPPPVVVEVDVAEGVQPEPGDNLLGWWIVREQRQTGRRPPDPDVGKQAAACRRIRGVRSAAEIGRAVAGMEHLYATRQGEPWDLMTLEKNFQRALSAKPRSEGNSTHDGGDWRARGDGSSDRDTPWFQCGGE